MLRKQKNLVTLFPGALAWLACLLPPHSWGSNKCTYQVSGRYSSSSPPSVLRRDDSVCH
ncbi:hypothetical protein BJY04DRAFT_190791 [Aspergillus karnatakaensis]|uniref:uncharacterized protein n=1 Tax=Aspergillus karnatakaensis TaxID=1810916 RepID=UPI003CCDE366